MITVEHLTKRYGEFTAVDDLSFEIEEGHVYGFLGPNGAGKSTTMNMITGCLSATEGRVKFRNISLSLSIILRINKYEIKYVDHRQQAFLF